MDGIAPYIVTGLFSIMAALISSRRGGKWVDEVQKKLAVLDALSGPDREQTTRAARIALERDIAATVLEHNGMAVRDGAISFKRESALRYQIYGGVWAFIPNVLLSYLMHPEKGLHSAIEASAMAVAVVMAAFIVADAILTRFPKAGWNRAYAVSAAKRVNAGEIVRKLS